MISCGLRLPHHLGVFSRRTCNIIPSSVCVHQHCSSSTNMPKTAGILIIGDEILKGQTQDTNSFYMCKTLRSVGVTVCQITVIGDDVDLISSEVKKYSEKFDLVLTSGGIGPTHDDMTLEAIAKAFDEKLYLNPTLRDLCKKYFGDKPVDSPQMKLAHLPASAELFFATDPTTGNPMKFPLIFLKNVYIFPGIPALLERQMDHSKHLFLSGDSFHSKTLLVNQFETDIANVMTKCFEKFSPQGLTLGSYPDWFNNYYKVKLIIECSDSEVVDKAEQFLHQNLPSGSILSDYKTLELKDGILPLFEKDFFRETSHSLSSNFCKSMEIFAETLRRYKREEICIGFNGGKDCTVLLHLYYSAVYKFDPPRAENLIGLFVKTEQPFEELERFMNEITKRYGLQTIKFEGGMKSELTRLHQERPEIKAVIMGTRGTDPYSKNLQPFTPTDGDWPPFMRVNPILDWSYHDIWTYLRSLYLPYCVLYDRGYTSLGGKNKTRRNEKLKFFDEQGIEHYRPAYTLQNSENERFGRL